MNWIQSYGKRQLLAMLKELVQIEISYLKKNIERKDWIIEDVGRDCFKEALSQTDIIIYINLKRPVLYWRIFKRWIRQKFKIEPAPYKCNFGILIQMYNWANNDIKSKKLDKLLVYKDKLIILDSKDIKKFKNSTYITYFFRSR